MTTSFIFLRLGAAIAIGLYLLACLLLYFTQERILFPGAFAQPPAELNGVASRFGLQDIMIPTADGTRLFALQSRPADRAPIVIVFHGNASYPESYSFLYAGWIAAGYGIVAPALRGYPRSGGTPDGEKMLADALDIYDWTAKTFPNHSIYLFGQSLGTAPAVHLAAHRPVAGVALVSPFKSMLSLAWSKFPYFPVPLLLRSPFRSDLDIVGVTAPILIFHGDRDTLVPITSGRELAALARHDLQFEVIRGAGHSTGLFDTDMIDRIDAFFRIDTH
jgi:hypothetical protein